ncbi:metal-dependent transcriptional regulator [Candidatus Micrarchaeota archaeon]|nr:metal-dependent transcriptional regulator [Candidatus Micrarchaeota archaeon]
MSVSDASISRISENYLRVISEIIDKKGYARVSDISKTLCVSAPSVTQMIQKLSKSGLINYEKRGAITLTSDGKEKADSIRKRYLVFLRLFEIAGVSKSTAYLDACYLEHQLSEETVSKLIDLVNKLETKS